MSFYQGRAYSVLHPTDFSEASEVAFAHALAVAINNKAELTIVHVVPDKHQEINWHEFPSVRATLERWAVLPPGASRSDVQELAGIHVEKRVAVNRSVVDAIVGLTDVDSFDLLVLGTRSANTNSFFAKSSSSATVAQRAQLPTLFVTEGARSCIDLATGKASVARVLLAVDHEPDAQPAINRVVTMLENIGGSHAEVTLLFVGQENEFPKVELPDASNVTWSRAVRQGTPATEITQHASDIEADLIVMVTAGQRDLWDIISGSTLQKVLKHAPCPVFTLPS